MNKALYMPFSVMSFNTASLVFHIMLINLVIDEFDISKIRTGCVLRDNNLTVSVAIFIEGYMPLKKVPQNMSWFMYPTQGYFIYYSLLFV